MSTAPAVELPGSEQLVLHDRQAWLLERRRYVTASDAPVILGISPWSTPMDLYARKVGVIEEQPSGERQKWGLRLQRVIADAYAEETGRPIVDLGEYTLTISKDRPWQAATLDYIAIDKDLGPGVLQVKNTSQGEEWEDGEGPLHYLAQLQHEIACAGVRWGAFAVLLWGNRLKPIDVPRNDRFIHNLVERERNFLHDVERRVMPAVDGREETARALNALYKTDKGGGAVMLPPEAVQVTQELENLTAAGKKLAAEIEARKNWLRSLIGDASYGVLPDGTGWSWKSHPVDGYSVAPGTQRPLRRWKGKS